MKIWDISLTISPNLPTWPGDPKAVIERVSAISDGANANVSRMDMGVHTGTHVDAPLHFIDGSSAVEAMNLEVLIGPARVVQVADDVNVIDREVLEKLELPAGTTRVLFKTRNSKYWASQVREFQTDFVGIDEMIFKPISLELMRAVQNFWSKREYVWWAWIIYRLRLINNHARPIKFYWVPIWSLWKGLIFLRCNRVNIS